MRTFNEDENVAIQAMAHLIRQRHGGPVVFLFSGTGVLEAEAVRQSGVRPSHIFLIDKLFFNGFGDPVWTETENNFASLTDQLNIVRLDWAVGQRMITANMKKGMSMPLFIALHYQIVGPPSVSLIDFFKTVFCSWKQPVYTVWRHKMKPVINVEPETAPCDANGADFLRATFGAALERFSAAQRVCNVARQFRAHICK